MRRATSHDGIDIAYWHLPASAGEPTFALAHATGFCAAVWDPVVSLLLNRYPGAGVLAVDQRAHGASAASPHPYDWWDIGRDLLAAVTAEGLDDVVGIGHSGGGAGVVLGELESPGSFAAMVLIEPIIYPPPFERTVDPPIARNAARRRSWFPSIDALRSRWEERPPFAIWLSAALDGYLSHGFVPGSNPETGEEGIVLACAPEDEAEWFRAAVEHGAWDRLREVVTPAVLIAGTESDTHGDGLAEALVERLGAATLHMVDGGSHFIPMEHPEFVVEAVDEVLSRR